MCTSNPITVVMFDERIFMDNSFGHETTMQPCRTFWEEGFVGRLQRLEEGTYAMPLGDSAAERRREITVQELGALLSGIDLQQATRRKRYRRCP